MKNLLACSFLLVAYFGNCVQGGCNPLCGTGVYTHAGTCQPSGRCLCFWGWTGPNAQYTTDNRILADYCRVPCHYTHDYKNPECVNSNHTGGECKVPSSTTPTKPCDPKCGNPPYHGRGQCLSDGRCLCWWGWTGPDACYVEDGKDKNRLIADYCVAACHYTPYVRNPKCLNGSWDGEKTTKGPTETYTTEIPTTEVYTTEIPTTQGITTEIPTTELNTTEIPTTELNTTDIPTTEVNTTEIPTTEVNTTEIPTTQGNTTEIPTTEVNTTEIPTTQGNTTDIPTTEVNTTDIPTTEVNTTDIPTTEVYTTEIPTTQGNTTEIPTTEDYTTQTPTEIQTTKVPCDPLCGTGVYTHAGSCQASGRCLCHYGWTGPHAQYTTGNRILADYCRVPCHYTHDYENPECVNSNHTGGECKVPESSTPTKPCDPRCGKPPYYGKGLCLSNGRCLCWWGWTGPEACYVEDGNYTNRIIADYCVTACHYTPVVRNETCLNGNWSDEGAKVTEKPVTVQKVKCDPSCGTGVYAHAGTCQDNGRCLCFWGWTGPNATYTTKNKILADYCRVSCHYTHDYANPECVTHSSNHTKHKCVLPKKSNPKVACDQRCGIPPNHGKGMCLDGNGRCLCWWGWTGRNACYIDDGYFHNRIIADYCEEPCHYTHDHRNATCLNLEWTENEIAKTEMTGSGEKERNISLKDILQV